MLYSTIEDCREFIEKLPEGNLIEWGVFAGRGINRIVSTAESVFYNFKEIYGFDSFTGLPTESENVAINPEWKPGEFSVCRDFNITSVEDAVKFVQNKINRKDAQLIPGFFKDSFDEIIGKKLENSCSYASIDVDLHSSTKEVLDFIFTYNILKNKAIIRYDDWIWSGYHHEEWSGGNSLAHLQAEIKYGIKFNRLTMNVFQYIK